MFFRYFAFNSQKFYLNKLFDVLFAQYIENVDQKKKTKIKNVNLNKILFVLMIFSTIRFTRNEWKKKLTDFELFNMWRKNEKRNLLKARSKVCVNWNQKRKIIITMMKNKKQNEIDQVMRQRNLQILHINESIVSSHENWSNLRSKLFH